MNKEQVTLARDAFRSVGYTGFTRASDAVRIVGPGKFGERLAVHSEGGEYVVYLRMGGKRVLSAKSLLISEVHPRVRAHPDALALPSLTPKELPGVLSRLVKALPRISAKVSLGA